MTSAAPSQSGQRALDRPLEEDSLKMTQVSQGANASFFLVDFIGEIQV